MPSEIRALGEFVEIKHGFAFSGRHIVSNETKRILLTPGHFEIGGGFRHNHKKYYDSEDYKPGYELEPGELIVSMTDLSKEGDTLGYSAIIPKIDGKILLHNQRIGSVIFKDEKLDKGFCHYLLRDRVYRQHILATCTGSTVKHTSPTKILDFRFALPEKSEQKAIAQILGTLDDKIELNQRMNQTLEDIAKAIFKSWFVDFNPVRAKVEGRPTGLPDEISNLFPDGLVDSEIGEIPVGWKITSLGDQTTLTKGRSYRSAELMDSDTALVTLKSFHRGGGYRLDGLKSYTGTYKEDQVLQQGDLIIALTDVTQAADVIGKPAIVRSSSDYSTLVASLDVGIIRAKAHSDITREFCYFLMLTDRYTQHSLGYTTGTTVLHLAKDASAKFEIGLPHKAVIDHFTAIASPLMQRIFAAEKENEILSELRDTLLPKLISGDLRIPDAEKFLEEAGI